MADSRNAPRSSIPISKSRSVSTHKPNRTPAQMDTARAKAKEDFILNELPPFKVEPSVEKGRAGLGLGADKDSSKRKRAETLRTSPSSERRDRQISGLQVRPTSSRGNSSGSEGRDRNPRPATAAVGSRGAASTLGLDQPFNRKVSAPAVTRAHSPVLATASTPRSASLNMLASLSSPSPAPTPTPTPTSSRLGVAAHFIPPGTTYTPPKGTNWDEVLLPTVAKKLGIGEGERAVGDEGDLAVEWDRDGTPVKWIKRAVVQRADPGETSEDSRRSPASFSPTFQPSPDNTIGPELPPHHPSIDQRRSNDQLEPQPIPPIPTTAAPPTTLSQDLEMLPIRTTAAPPTTLSRDPPILAPALAPALASTPTPPPPMTHDRLRPIETPSRPSTLSHRSSNLREKPSRRPSQQSLQDPRIPPTIQVQAPTPVELPKAQDRPSDLRRISKAGQQTRDQMKMPAAKRRDDPEDVGNGCRCIIM